MTDFLSQLAARSRSSTPALQPRVLGRFESFPGERRSSSEDLLETSAEAAQAMAVPANQSNATFVNKPPYTARDSIGASTRLDQTVAPAQPIERASPTAQPRMPPFESPVTSVEVPAVSKQPTPHPVEIADRERPIERPENIHPVIDRPSPRTVRTPPTSTGREGAEPIHASRTVDAAEPAQTPSTRADSTTASRDPLQEITVRNERPTRSVPVVATARPASEASSSVPPAAAATPVVQVTIGRIEVRAVTAASALPPSHPMTSPKNPGQSLDEYLRQRSGGR